MTHREDGIHFRSREPISHWLILAGIVRDQGGEEGQCDQLHRSRA